MLVSMFGFGNAGKPPRVVLDPSRVAAQIVTGIGFLGAGVIIFRKQIIRGLTTAASIWLVAALGMAVGGGLYLPALGATVFGLAILAVMKPLERALSASQRSHRLTLVIDRRRISLSQLEDALRSNGALFERLDARLSDNPAKSRVDILLERTSNERLMTLLQSLADRTGIEEVRSTLGDVVRASEEGGDDPSFAPGDERAASKHGR